MRFVSRLLGNAGVVDSERLVSDYSQLLTEDETIEIGFKVIRDTLIFTDRRLILVDIQGVTGRKTEYRSIPYSKITQFSVESAGHFDLDAELKIWVGSDPNPIQKKFSSEVSIYDVQKILAAHVH